MDRFWAPNYIDHIPWLIKAQNLTHRLSRLASILKMDCPACQGQYAWYFCGTSRRRVRKPPVSAIFRPPATFTSCNQNHTRLDYMHPTIRMLFMSRRELPNQPGTSWRHNLPLGFRSFAIEIIYWYPSPTGLVPLSWHPLYLISRLRARHLTPKRSVWEFEAEKFSPRSLGFLGI